MGLPCDGGLVCIPTMNEPSTKFLAVRSHSPIGIYSLTPHNFSGRAPIFVRMNEISDLTKRLVQFRNDRDWAKFHNPKDLAAAISIEAGELLEVFLWKDAAEARLDKVREELADVLAYALLLAEHYGLDVSQVVMEKIARNAEKYPVEKAKGNARKYDEL